MTRDFAPPIDPAQARAVDALRSGQRFLLAGHVRPDGDCIGAQAALARVLSSLGKQVWIYNPDPPEPQLDYLARDFTFRAYDGGALPAHDWCVLLDISELSRCGPLEPALRAASSRKMIVDHHIHHGDAWWDEAFVDTSASATGLLVLRIARALGAPIDAAVARAVFTSLVTDTGWFKYSNTDAETLRAAADMLDAGARSHELYNAIYQRLPSAQPLALARALARVEYAQDGRLALVDLPRGEPELADSDLLLDILRAVGSVEVVLFLRENADGKCKLSARSKGAFDVNALARRFGGGGHSKASGATLPGPLSEARAQLLAAALEAFARGANR